MRTAEAHRDRRQLAQDSTLAEGLDSRFVASRVHCSLHHTASSPGGGLAGGDICLSDCPIASGVYGWNSKTSAGQQQCTPLLDYLSAGRCARDSTTKVQRVYRERKRCVHETTYRSPGHGMLDQRFEHFQNKTLRKKFVKESQLASLPVFSLWTFSEDPSVEADTLRAPTTNQRF
ncbi:uncharacterized protein ACBT57_000702 [Dama dama]